MTGRLSGLFGHQIPDKSDQAGLPCPAHAFGGKDLLYLGKAGVEIIVDQDIVITVPMADLAGSALHPALDNLGRIGVAAFQPFAQFIEGRRQDEDADNILSGALIQLLGPLPVDIEQYILSVRQTLVNRNGRVVTDTDIAIS